MNKFDQFCKEHDIIYSKNRDHLDARREANKVLAKKAIGRVFAKDAKLCERLVGLGVDGVMKLTRELGGRRLLGKKSRKGGSLKKNNRKEERRKRSMMRRKRNRIISVPSKIEGVLPLFPLFAGSIVALASGGATDARAINQARSNERQLYENARHNEHMGAIAMGKAGKSFRMRPCGYGFRMKPWHRKAIGFGLKQTKKKV